MCMYLLVACLIYTGDPSSWTVDDVIRAESASSFVISPNSEQAVWVKSSHDSEKNEFRRHLFITDLKTGEIRQLTQGAANCTSPKWSPDGINIAFLSSREQPGVKKKPEGNQIWILPLQGGDSWPLTSEQRQIQDYAWKNNESLICMKEEDAGYQETQVKELKDQGNAIDDASLEPPIRLFEVELESKKLKRLTSNNDRMLDMTLSNQGRHIVTVHERSASYGYDNKVPPGIYLHDLKQNTKIELFVDRQHIAPGSYYFSPDGERLFALVERSSHPVYVIASITEVHEIDLKTGKSNQIDIAWERGIGRDFAANDSGFTALLANGARSQFVRYERDKKGQYIKQVIASEMQGHIQSFSSSKSGARYVFAHSTSSKPTQWFSGILDKKANLNDVKVITKLNPSFEKKRTAKTEVIEWIGANGDSIEGILYYPQDYVAGKTYPLVVMIHGGPASLDMDAWAERWAYPHQLFTQRGALILKPNYHGSAHYGLDFVESIGGGNYYDLEVIDIENGVDHLIEKGLADPEQLGIMGWSNGAILTTAMTIRTTRFKAASAGAGDVDWTSDWANCGFGASFDDYYFGATPFSDPDLYRAKSPFFQLEKVTTPTIIFHGDKDTAVPTQQGWMHFRALQQLGKVDTRFILFPGEPHGLLQLAHQKRKIDEELAWFDRFLFKTSDDSEKAVKEDSPLAVLRSSSNFAHINGAWGVLDQGVLRPETVVLNDLKVARFEVTRRQFAEFNPKTTVIAGQENMPMHAVEAEQALAYCQWLSEKTGSRYRLPKKDELKGYDKPAGNILDDWAGYAPNPDDAASLQKIIAALPSQTSIIKAVGSGKPLAKDQLIFDLDGNLGEWVSGPDNELTCVGGCAFLSADQSKNGVTCPPFFSGFRVVQEAETSN